MYNEDIKQQPVSFIDLESAYSDFATNFIMMSSKNKQPFFLYYPSHVSIKINLGEKTNHDPPVMKLQRGINAF